ncbi:titin-like [Dermacentor silvarum]|uniref:titin-like n=1 Tax=Dermacentor silvarum TaxID=543639 RepID=UPI0021009971|nr:titin-like [Dermacentor silvarum]
MERDIGAAPTCGEDEDQVQKNLQMLRERLSFLDREVRATSRSAHERYSERRQGVPDVVEQALASVELLSENVMAALEGKEREFKKARTARADYCEGSKALAAWLQKAQGILQRKGDSPEVTKENLVALNAELPGVRRDADRRVVQSGNLVVECLGDTEQAKSVRATITSLTDQLQQVESWIRERLGEVEDALEAWARFLQLHEVHKTWLDMKELAVAKREPLNTLAMARQCLSQCQEVNRDMASGQGQLAEMSGLVQRIGRSCHVGPLLEKLDAAEERQRNLEGRLVQELALLQELVEEWEQCERKARDCQTWLERARSSLEAPQLRRKSLRDQLALREKMLADLSSQQTKMAMSLEKLRVHLRVWASYSPEENAMVATVQELSRQLQALQGKLDSRCQELSACLAQDEQYSQDLLHVRQLLSQSEHRLKLALGAIGNTPAERTLNLKLQEGADVSSETIPKLSGQALGSFMDVPAGQEYMAFYQSRPQTVVTREQRPDGTSQVTRTTTRLVSAVSTGQTGGQPHLGTDGGRQPWQLSESFRSLTSPDDIQAYTANLEPQRRSEQLTTVSTVSGTWSSEHDSPMWESWQSQPTEGHARFGTSWVVTRHDRSPSPMPFLAAATERNSTQDTTDTHPQAVTVTTGELAPVLSGLPGEPRVLRDSSVDDELRALSSLTGRQEPAPGEVKLVESEFKREVEPLNLVSSRVVQDTEEKKTIELKFQEKVQLVHYSFQLPSFAEFVQAPEEDVHEVRPLDSSDVAGVAASEMPGEKQTTTEVYSVRVHESEVDTRKLMQRIGAHETVSDVVSTQHSQGWTPGSVVEGAANVPAKAPAGTEKPSTTTSKQVSSIHTVQHQEMILDKVQTGTGEGITSTLVFPADSVTETSQSQTRREVVSRTAVTVRQLSPGEASAAADLPHLFPNAKATKETGKEGEKGEPVLASQKPGTVEVDAVVMKGRVTKSPARGLTTSTTDVGSTVYDVTTDLQKLTNVTAFEEPGKAPERANGHPKHLELQTKESPLPSITVTKTLSGQHEVDSGTPPLSSGTGTEAARKPLPSQPEQGESTPLTAKETGEPTSLGDDERKATGDEAPANGQPKHLKKSSKQKKKDHSPSPAPQVQDTKTSSNPLDRFGKKVKKFAMNLFSGDGKHSSDVTLTEDAQKEQPVQPDIETKKKKKSKKKSKAPLPEQPALVTPPRAETESDKHDVTQPTPVKKTDESQPLREGSDSTLTTPRDKAPADVSRQHVILSDDSKQPHSVPTSVELDAKVPAVMPGSAQTPHGMMPAVQSDKLHGAETDLTVHTISDPCLGEVRKDEVLAMTQQSHDRSSTVPSYVPVYAQPSISGKDQSPQKYTKELPLQSVDSPKAEHDISLDKPETGKPKAPSEESTLTIIYGVPTITTTTIIQPSQIASLPNSAQMLQPGDNKQQPDLQNNTGIDASSGLPKKTSHRDFTSAAATKAVIKDGSKPHLKEDKQHPGKKKEESLKKETGLDNQPKDDKHGHGKVDEPKEMPEEQSLNKYSEVLITEAAHVIREGEHLRGPYKKTLNVIDTTIHGHQEVSPKGEHFPATSYFSEAGLYQQPEHIDRLKEETIKKHITQSNVPTDQDYDDTHLITELTDIIRECRRERPQLGAETFQKPEIVDKEPGKKKKGKPKKPSDEPHDLKEPETVIVTEVTRIINEGEKEPGFPGAPGAETQEPTKLPSREGTPGKEPTSTIFGWKETPEKPEADDKEPGKKKKSKPRKPSDEPHDQKEPETVIITEVTRIIQEAEKEPEIAGEPGAETQEPTKLPSREGTPGKEPTPTIFGLKETPEKPEADDKEPGKKKKGKPKKPSVEPHDEKEPETVIITEVTRIIKEGEELLGFPGEPGADTQEPAKLPSREGTPGKELSPTIFGLKETPEKPEADDKEPGKKKKGKPKKPSDEPHDQKQPETVIITEVTRIIKEGEKLLGFPGEPGADTQEPAKLPSREGTPGKELSPTIFGLKETPEKPEADDKEPGKKKKGKPKKPSEEPHDQTEAEKVIITEVTRIIKESKKEPEFPGEPGAETQEPTKLPSREGTPGKEPTSTIFGWKETPEKPEADDKEPGKKKKGKPRKPSDEPHDQQEPETVNITGVTRIIEAGKKLLGFPGEPGADTQEPAKLLSREGTPRKELSPTIFGWKETPEKPEANDKEPGKKVKPEKPSDEPHDQKEPEAVIITEVTRIIQEGEKEPEFPGEPRTETQEPTKLPSREGTPGKELSPTIFDWKETPEKPEADDKEPGKKKKGKPRKPSDEPHDQKDAETVIITEVTPIIKESDKEPVFPGEPGAEMQEPAKFPSTEGTPGKEISPTILGWKQTPEKPEADDKEPGKKKTRKPKKPSDEPLDQEEPETVIITEVTRIIKEGEKLLGFPGEPGADTQEPAKVPSREGTPGKKLSPTIFGWKETPEKPEADDKEPGKKKKSKPRKPSDELHDQKEPETVIITEVTRIIKEGQKEPGFPGEPGAEMQEPTKIPSREGIPGKEPTSTLFGWKETPEKPEANDNEPGKKGKPEKPSDEPHDQKEPETVPITGVTRIIEAGKKLLGFPGEPGADTQEPAKLPSREGTPGKEPTSTIIGWKETPEKPEADDKEPGKKKKGKAMKPSHEPHDQKEPETVIITEVTRIIQEGKKEPVFPGEPGADTQEPAKLPSREGTPGKELSPTIFGWKETPEKPEADDKEPEKKKKSKLRKPSDEPHDLKEPETVIITEVTRIIKEGEREPEFPGEPGAETQEPIKLPSREDTLGKEASPSIFGWKETPEKPEADDKEPGKKKKGKSKKPSDEPHDQKDPETVITEVTRITQEGEKEPEFPGEIGAETQEPAKILSREGTPGKEPSLTIFGWRETPEKPEADDKEPGKKKKGMPKKPSDEPHDLKEPETVIITEVTRIIKEGKKEPEFPGEPGAETQEPAKILGREGTAGKEPTSTIFGWKETPEKPEADDKEPGKKKKGKPMKPSDEPHDQKDPKTVITEMTRIVLEGEKLPGFPGEAGAETQEPTKILSREGAPREESTVILSDLEKSLGEPECKKELARKVKATDILDEESSTQAGITTDVSCIVKEGEKGFAVPAAPSAFISEPSNRQSEEGTQEEVEGKGIDERQSQGWFSSLVAVAKSITSWDSTDDQVDPAARNIVDSDRSPVQVSLESDILDDKSEPQVSVHLDATPQSFDGFERAVPSAPIEPETSFLEALRPGQQAPFEPRFSEGLQSFNRDVPSTAVGDSRIVAEQPHPSDISSEHDDNMSIYSTGTDDSFSVLHSHRPYDEPKAAKGRQKKHKQRQKGETFLVASAVSSHAGRRSASKSPSPPSERGGPSTYRDSRKKTDSSQSPPPPGFIPDVLGKASATQWVPEDSAFGTSLVERRRRDVVDYTVQTPAPERSAQASAEKVDELVKADTTTSHSIPPLPGQQSSMGQMLYSWIPSFGAVPQTREAPVVKRQFNKFSDDGKQEAAELHRGDGSEQPAEAATRFSADITEGRLIESPTSSGVDTEGPLPEWLIDPKWPSRMTTVMILVFRQIFIIERLLREASSLRGNERHQKIQEAQQHIDGVSQQLYDEEVCQILELYHLEHPEMARHYRELSDQLQQLARQLDSTESQAPQAESLKLGMDEQSMQFWLGLESLHVWISDLQRLLSVHLDALSNPVVLKTCFRS